MPLLKGCHPCLCKAKAAPGHPSLNPDTASTQCFIITSLPDCLQEHKRDNSTGEGQKAELEEGFLQEGTELTSGQIAQHFSISMYVLTSPRWMGGLSLKTQCMKVSGKKLMHQKPKVLPHPLILLG